MAEFIYQMYQARKAHGDKVITDEFVPQICSPIMKTP